MACEEARRGARQDAMQFPTGNCICAGRLAGLSLPGVIQIVEKFFHQAPGRDKVRQNKMTLLFMQYIFRFRWTFSRPGAWKNKLLQPGCISWLESDPSVGHVTPPRGNLSPALARPTGRRAHSGSTRREKERPEFRKSGSGPRP